MRIVDREGATSDKQGSADRASASHATVTTGIHLDSWYNTYADRALGMRQSEVRSLLAVVNRPEVVSLAGGMPNIEGLPLEFLAEMSSRLLRDRGASILQYGSGQGSDELREMVVEVMHPDGIHGHADDVVVTTGSQQAPGLISQIFIDPDDVVLAEAPSYVGALGAFRVYQANVMHVPMDAEGLVPEELVRVTDELEAEGRPIKFLYTISNFHNPGGVCPSAEHRPHIAEICQRRHILVVEDNPYGLLGSDGDPIPAIQSINPDGVVYLGSFSKMFMPGYRIGWALAPTAVAARLILANENTLLCPSTFAQLSINEYLRTYDWYQQVKEYREMYHERGRATQEALEEYIPMCFWNSPEGGSYTWVKLPKGLDAQATLPRAITNLVAYVSGTAFYADGQGRDHMRLSFCYPTPERIRKGTQRLAAVVRAEAELVDMFGLHGGGGTKPPPGEFAWPRA